MQALNHYTTGSSETESAYLNATKLQLFAGIWAHRLPQSMDLIHHVLARGIKYLPSMGLIMHAHDIWTSCFLAFECEAKWCTPGIHVMSSLA